jgi:hypothetical protein
MQRAEVTHVADVRLMWSRSPSCQKNWERVCDKCFNGGKVVDNAHAQDVAISSRTSYSPSEVSGSTLVVDTALEVERSRVTTESTIDTSNCSSLERLGLHLACPTYITEASLGSPRAMSVGNEPTKLKNSMKVFAKGFIIWLVSSNNARQRYRDCQLCLLLQSFRSKTSLSRLQCWRMRLSCGPESLDCSYLRVAGQRPLKARSLFRGTESLPVIARTCASCKLKASFSCTCTCCEWCSWSACFLCCGTLCVFTSTSTS